MRSFIFSFRRLVSPALLAVLLAAFGAELAARRYAPLLVDRGRMAIRFKRDLVMAGERKDDVVFLGSSHVAAFDAAAMEKKFPGLRIYNFAVPNTSSIRQHMLELAVICGHGPAPGLVVFSVPLAAFFDYDPTRMPSLLKDGARPDPERVYASGQSAPLALFDVVPVLRTLCRSGRLRSPADLMGIIKERRARLENMRATGGQMLFGEDSRLEPARLRDFFPAGPAADGMKPLDLAIADLGRMADYAGGQGARIVFVNMPMPGQLSAELKERGWLDALRMKLRGLERGHANFSFVEIAEFYDWPLNFFSDPLFHVNRDGAAALNKVFATRYLENIINKSPGPTSRRPGAKP